MKPYLEGGDPYRKEAENAERMGRLSWLKEMDKIVEVYVLEVPYAEKDNAKALGAKWNPGIKKWCFENAQDIERFGKWFQGEIVKKDKLPHNRIKYVKPAISDKKTLFDWGKARQESWN